MGFFSWPRNRLRSKSGGSIRSHGSPGRRATFRPQLEALEDRCVPSTLTVTNNLDGPVGSLRYEINAANNGDTILFAPSLKGQTITLGGSELGINKNLDIEGLGAGNLAISGGNRSRVFDVTANVTLAGMTITGGNEYLGGGILNYGTLTVSNSTISGNRAFGSFGNGGGGIYNGTWLTVSNSTISGNSANYGGGIYNGRTLTVSSCTVSNNNATFDGGGIYNDGWATVSNSVVLNNVAPSGGADIYSVWPYYYGSQLTLISSTVGEISYYFVLTGGCCP